MEKQGLLSPKRREVGGAVALDTRRGIFVKRLMSLGGPRRQSCESWVEIRGRQVWNKTFTTGLLESENLIITISHYNVEAVGQGWGPAGMNWGL